MNGNYAGFWIRVLASLIDGVVITLPIFVIDYILYILAGPDLPYFDYSFGDAGAEMWTSYDTLSLISALLIAILYYGWLTSKYKGTIGKLVLRLQVVNENGEAISFGRAVGRYFAYMLSGIFYIGYIMVGLTKKKQGLHDMICNTYVVRNVVQK